MKAKVVFKERSHWGGGRVSGGLTYTPDPSATILFANGEKVRVQFSELYRASADARAQHQKLVDFLLEKKKEAAFASKVLYLDNWTGACLEAPVAEIEELELPDFVFDGILAQIRSACAGIAHGGCSCHAEIASQYSTEYADLAIARYPDDWCGYGKVN